MAQVLCSFAGVAVRRVVDRAGGVVPEHAHDWPVLSLFVMGGYRNTTELGDVDLAGPSAVLYRAGATHANAIGADGFEQIEVEFDPRWLRLGEGPAVLQWVGGPAASAARALAVTCRSAPDERELREAVAGFLGQAEASGRTPTPSWIDRVEAMLRNDASLRVRDIAARLGRHPAWLGAAYAVERGEGLAQAAARFRVERAARRLRETDDTPADIAAAAGFCDQSHMIRVFRRLLGRSPSAVRADRTFMRETGAAA